MKLFLTHKFRSAGDAARDKECWADAAAAYKNHLLDCPDDAEIWVQLGHALKEQGRLREAEDAYREAVSLRPDDADGSLHLAHLLKRSGRVAEAAEMFAHSFKSLPSGDAYNELKKLGGTIPFHPASNSAVADTLLIEIDDLFGYLEAHKTLSGIQRVQVEIIQHVLNARGENDIGAFVVNSNDSDCLDPAEAGCMWRLQDEHLHELVNYVTGAQVDHANLKRIIARARNGASLVTPQMGQTYLVLGAFWGTVEATRRYVALKRSGVLLGAYIYDLIPVTHPEYCDARLSHEFSLCFADAMAVFDFVLTISAFTAKEVERYRKKYDLPPIPVISVPLAHSHAGDTQQQPMGWTPRIGRFKNRPFVLMVSTIEARKNHSYLVAAWKQFLEEGLDPPDLVFVGRVGWHVSSLMEMLELTRYLDGRVHILHDLSDVELRTLYRACLFTAFPSFIEGWGLPVGESLACGRPCVASSTSSIPEVGGDLIDYLDPHNLRAGLEVLRKMTFDTVYRAKRERAIASQFVARHWRDVGAELLAQVGKMKTSVTARPDFQVLFPAGSVFKISDLAFGHPLPQDYCLCPKRLMLAPFCYAIENHGCWIQGSQGKLTFRSNLRPGSGIIFYISVLGMPLAGPEHMITARSQHGNTIFAAKHDGARKPVLANARFILRCLGNVDENGVISISLTIKGDIPAQLDDQDTRRFVAGLAGFGYAACDDAIARADICEALLFDL